MTLWSMTSELCHPEALASYTDILAVDVVSPFFQLQNKMIK